MCTSVPPHDWHLLQWNTGLQALPEGIKPPLILIQFVGARLQTCAFIEKDKSFGIEILQGALGVCRRAGSHLGDRWCFLAWHEARTHMHARTHSSVNSSPDWADSGPWAEDETQHSNPAVRGRATALPKALLSHVRAATCSRSNWEGERALGGWVGALCCSAGENNLLFPLRTRIQWCNSGPIPESFYTVWFLSWL